MRRMAAACVMLLMAVAVFAGKKPETIDELKARAAQAKPQDQVKLFMEVAQRQLDSAGRSYDAGDSDKAKAEIEDVSAYAEKAGDAAMQTGKRVKRTEIDVRKLAQRMEALRRSLSVDDRPPLEAAGERLEKLDSRLLDHMFKGKKK